MIFPRTDLVITCITTPALVSVLRDKVSNHVDVITYVPRDEDSNDRNLNPLWSTQQTNSIAHGLGWSVDLCAIIFFRLSRFVSVMLFDVFI